MLLVPMLVALAAAQLSTADSRPVILAFGDSLTSGYGVPPGLGYPEQLQKKLDASGYSYRVVNMGVAGDTTKSGRVRINNALALKPTIVILELGGNDSGELALTQTGTNLEEMIRLFRNGGITVVLAQVDSELSKVFTELARKYGSDRPFALVLRIVEPTAYGTDFTELVADVSDVAFQPVPPPAE